MTDLPNGKGVKDLLDARGEGVCQLVALVEDLLPVVRVVWVLLQLPRQLLCKLLQLGRDGLWEGWATTRHSSQGPSTLRMPGCGNHRNLGFPV